MYLYEILSHLRQPKEKIGIQNGNYWLKYWFMTTGCLGLFIFLKIEFSLEVFAATQHPTDAKSLQRLSN